MSRSGYSRSGFMPARVVHLHASRFCNLACKHCYSDSSPHLRDGLATETIISALPILRDEGYEVLSLSGGEPLLYSGFEAVVRSATAIGFQVNLITNGAPVGGRLLDLIAEHVNLVAVSLDGAPSLHAELRGDENAFARAERALNRLKAANVRFGIAYCVSRESITDMPWAVEFAEEKGAALVQFHPFAATGRGKQFANRLGLSEPDKARAYLIATLLDADDGINVHIDLAPVEIAQTRRDDYSILSLEAAGTTSLSDLINPLIIDEKGVMLPLSYGINPRLAIGSLGANLSTIIQSYNESGWGELHALLDTSFKTLGTHGEKFVDWFYHLVETSFTLGYSPTGVGMSTKTEEDRLLSMNQ